MMGLCCVVRVAVVTVACLQLWAGLSLYVRSKTHTHDTVKIQISMASFCAVANDCKQTIHYLLAC